MSDDNKYNNNDNYNNDWEKHSMLVLETLKDLKAQQKEIEKRVAEIEKKIYMALGIISFLVFALELFLNIG